MKRSNKKGFTIVELVIVIAIIAILAAVLIPTFASLIAKANLSNDQQAIRNMNTSLAVQVVPNTKFTYAGDAVNALYMDGWNMGKLKTYSNGFHYAYNLDDNKMYLVDNTGKVIYPEEVDKSKLYGFYDGSATAKIEGITKYIALSNIVGADDFGQLIAGDDSYTIDLNGFFFGIEKKENETEKNYENVTLVNGIILSGMATAKHESDVVEYKTQAMEDTEAGGTYENKVFYKVDSTVEDYKYTAKAGVTYKNCIFYNSSVRTNDEYTEDAVITFDNCSFIGSLDKDLAPIEVYDNTDKNLTVVIKNCTFTQTKRGINFVNSSNKNGMTTVKIDGCTFNGTTNDKFAALQIAESTNTKVEFINNTVNALGNAPAIVRYHNAFFAALGENEKGTDKLPQFTFSGNTVSGNIPESKYVDLDQHKDDEFYNEALKLFKAGLK